MSRGISGGKQVTKLLTRVPSLFIPSKENDDFILAKCTVRVSTSFMSLFLAVSTRTVNTAYKNVVMITSTHNCLEQSNSAAICCIGGVVFLLANHVTSLLSHQSLNACKDGGYRE